MLNIKLSTLCPIKPVPEVLVHFMSGVGLIELLSDGTPRSTVGNVGYTWNCWANMATVAFFLSSTDDTSYYIMQELSQHQTAVDMVFLQVI